MTTLNLKNLKNTGDQVYGDKQHKTNYIWSIWNNKMFSYLRKKCLCIKNWKI